MNRRLLAYSIAGAVFLLDRLTKLWIESSVSAMEKIVVIPGFFNIVHSKNRGAAFGMFHDSDSPLRPLLLIGFSLAAVVVVAAMLWRPAKLDRFSFYGLSLVLGGAAGNVWDRALRGEVTDFLEFYVGSYYWPSFNVADSAIVCGCGLLILEVLAPKRAAAGA